MKHTVIGTAGHIDHGKTLLLRALTGMDADRLPEEKARGMTIDLGFAFLGTDITFIDVPGHEKFIKNMLAGVSTIDLVLLVIAADDGIMPQTREHLEILKLLNIKKGIIAVTKIDLVEKDWLELVKEDIRQFVKESFLENAPIVCVSSVTGEGISDLKALIDTIISELPQRIDKKIFRLWVDRVFVLKGIGTIVAGTVLSGSIKVGDKLELLPPKKIIRVRKLQMHNIDVEESRIGERVAINLIGVEMSEIERGYVLAQPDQFETTYMVNAKLYLLHDTQPIVSRTRVRFYIGTRELLARVIILERRTLEPGNSALVQFRLEEPIAPEIGDRFIIRSYSPAYTIGGGIIIEVHPQKLKYLPDEDLERLDKLEKADPEQLILHHLANNPLSLCSIDTLAKDVSFNQVEVQTIVTLLLDKGIITPIVVKPSLGVVLTEHMKNAQSKIRDFLTNYHRQFTYLRGIKLSELKTKLFPDTDIMVYDKIIAAMTANKEIAVDAEIVSLAGYTIAFSPRQEEIKKKIETIYLKSRYVTPSIEELYEQFPDIKKTELNNIVTGMIESGILIEIKTDVEKPVLFHSKLVAEAEKLLIEILHEKGEIRLFEFRELINSTRKFTTPLLIYFDRKCITERQGDIRVLKNV